MLQPVRKQTLSDAVFEQLRDRIVHGELEAGSRLPAERELCELLQVNRGALREALKRLEQARLVRMHHGGATRILNYRDEAGLDLLPALLVDPEQPLNIQVAESVLEMRSALAPEMARLAAIRGGPQAAERLEAIVHDMHESRANLDSLHELAMEFWAEIARASNNIAYRLVSNTLRESYRQFRSLLTGILAREYRDHDSYAAIARAVRHADSVAAQNRAAALTRIGESGVASVLETLRLEGTAR